MEINIVANMKKIALTLALFLTASSLYVEKRITIFERNLSPINKKFKQYHLSPNSLLVSVGDIVSQGDPIAMSGSSGFTDPPGVSNPHLHFDVLTPPFINCGNGVFSGCKTVPIAFRNANPLDVPLIEDKTYKALPF